jgi:hypothetical protein
MNPTQAYPHLVRELVLTWAQPFIAFFEGASWLSEAQPGNFTLMSSCPPSIADPCRA